MRYKDLLLSKKDRQWKDTSKACWKPAYREQTGNVSIYEENEKIRILGKLVLSQNNPQWDAFLLKTTMK